MHNLGTKVGVGEEGGRRLPPAAGFQRRDRLRCPKPSPTYRESGASVANKHATCIGQLHDFLLGGVHRLILDLASSAVACWPQLPGLHESSYSTYREEQVSRAGV